MEESQDMIHNIKVYETQSDGSEHVIFVGDRESVRNFIGNTAFTLNFGMYRYWNKDGNHYYDCGPVIYYTKVPIELEITRAGSENAK